jgi:hypothetical protein
MPAALMPSRWGRFTIVFAAALAALAQGCNKAEVPSDYDRQKGGEQDALAALKSRGAKVTHKDYPAVQRKGYVVGLAGKQVDGDLLDRLKGLRPLSELDLSKSNVTDAQLDKLNDKELGGFLILLDLSHTAVTDDGLDRLTNLTMLTTLNLAGTKTTAAAAERLRERLLQPRLKDARTPGFMKQLTIKR